MKTHMSVMNEKIEKLGEIVYRQERYLRCNGLFLHCIAGNEGENTDDLVLKTVNEKINIELSSLDLDKTHPIGLKENSQIGSQGHSLLKSEVIIQENNFFQIKQLKNKGVSIT